MSKFYDVEQNDEEWFELRLGRFTASMIVKLFSKKTTAAYKDTIFRCAFERAFKKQPEDSEWSNAYMERGHALEHLAVESYEDITFAECTNGGFFAIDDWVGASPDRCIKGKNAGIEVKCPAFTTMIKYS